MGTFSGGHNDERRASRFATRRDEDFDLEGGVRGAGTSARGASGAPGPAERRLDISELARTTGMRYTHRFHIPPFEAEYVSFAEPLHGEVTLTNTGALLLLRGRVRTDLRMECGRCLEPYVQPVDAELEEEFDLVSSTNAFHQEEVRAVDEDTPASVIEGNVLDLGELLRQNLLLAAPLQPLCREDCSGLHRSGSPEEAVPDRPAAGDSRLSRLAELIAAKEQDEE